MLSPDKIYFTQIVDPGGTNGASTRHTSLIPSAMTHHARSNTIATALLCTMVACACMKEATAQRRPRLAARRAVTPISPVVQVLRVAQSVAPQSPSAGEPAANAATARVMSQLEEIESTLRTAHYRHDTSVNVAQGRYDFDCSGMIAWVLARTAPTAHRATLAHSGGSRPLAADYARHILRVADDNRAHDGWRRVARVEDARPGDILAWIKPRIVRSNNTGHIGFVVGQPVRSSTVENGWLVRIADSSSYQHQDDSREGTNRTGFGRGTLLITADPSTGVPRAFGWFGENSSWILETAIAIGRPVR